MPYTFSMSDSEHALHEHIRAERVRRTVEAFAVDAIRYTISAGVAEAEGEETLESLMARADAALYTAKNEGRNRVAA